MEWSRCRYIEYTAWARRFDMRLPGFQGLGYRASWMGARGGSPATDSVMEGDSGGEGEILSIAVAARVLGYVILERMTKWQEGGVGRLLTGHE